MDKYIAHILVVDDDDGIRLLVKKYLNENNFLVTTSDSAENTSDKVKIIKFDLILLDIMKKGQSGLNFLKENKKRYDILYKEINKYAEIRQIPINSTPIYDTFIFEPKKNKNKIIKYLNSLGVGTKNLPDAIRWHCSYFWGHALDRKNVKNSLTTKHKLQKKISIPILLKQSLSKYTKVANRIAADRRNIYTLCLISEEGLPEQM